MNKKIFTGIILKTIFYSSLMGVSPEFHPKTIAIVGTGYVGLVSGACLAELGHRVTCIDIDETKIKRLRAGDIPIYEPGLDEVVKKNVANNRLLFTTSLSDGIDDAHIIFIAVGTPTNEETGEVDLSLFKKVIHDIAPLLTTYKIIVVKSTVPIGTNDWVTQKLTHTYNIPQDKFAVVSNPEFLREGTALYDFMNPDRIVVGSSDEKAISIIKNVYIPLLNEHVSFLSCNTSTAETIKYASNCFLAMKISYINEIATICRKTNADITLVAQGMGLDPRIGKHFLNPGPGFGGSCLPKDTRAIVNKAKELHLRAPVIESILASNQLHQKIALDFLNGALEKDIKNKTIGILGLAFKANTDDIRYSPAIPIINQLLKQGAYIKAYDPAAMKNMYSLFPDIEYCVSAQEALDNADAGIILTEWQEFKNLNIETIAASMKKRIIIDMRNILDVQQLKHFNFKVYGIHISEPKN